MNIIKQFNKISLAEYDLILEEIDDLEKKYNEQKKILKDKKINLICSFMKTKRFKNSFIKTYKDNIDFLCTDIYLTCISKKLLDQKDYRIAYVGYDDESIEEIPIKNDIFKDIFDIIDEIADNYISNNSLYDILESYSVILNHAIDYNAIRSVFLIESETETLDDWNYEEVYYIKSEYSKIIYALYDFLKKNEEELTEIILKEKGED